MTRSGSTLRVGFIGAGFSAHLHAEAYHQVRGVDVALTRGAAARPERAKRFAEEFGVAPVAASAEGVLAAPDVDVLDLCILGEESPGGTQKAHPALSPDGGEGGRRGSRLRGRPVRPRAVMAETAQLTETDTFTAAGKPFLNTVPGADEV
jgi:hypothetical protein